MDHERPRPLDYARRPPVPSNLHLKWVIRGLWVLAGLAALGALLLWVASVEVLAL